MRVLFLKITYKDVPLVWDYDEKTNQAECLFISQKKPCTNWNKNEILDTLRNIPNSGITFTQDSAFIENCSEYIKALPPTDVEMQLIPPLSRKPIIRNRSQSEHSILIESPNPVVVSNDKDPRSPKFVKAQLPRLNLGNTPMKGDHLEKNRTLNSDRSHHKRKKSSLLFSEQSPDLQRSSHSRKVSDKYSPRFYDEKQKKKSKPDGFTNILLENLIVSTENTDDIFRNTLGYRNKFIQFEKNSFINTKFLKHPQTFFSEMVFSQQQNFCSLKRIIITIFEDELFREQLNPAYVNWKKQKGKQFKSQELQEFGNYLAKAVQSAMVNTTFEINKPTEYELLTETKRQELFHNNIIRFNEANEGIRRVRARLMLGDLLDLIDKNSLFKGTSIPKLLSSFRDYLITDKVGLQKIKKILREIESLIIQSGELDYKNVTDQTILKHYLANKEKLIENCYYSLSNIIKNLLMDALKTHKIVEEKKYPLFEKKSMPYIKKVLIDVVNFLQKNEEFQLVPEVEKLSYYTDKCCYDPDLYLHKDWAEACCKSITEGIKGTYNNGLLKDDWISILKSIKNNEKLEKMDLESIKIAFPISLAIRIKGAELIKAQQLCTALGNQDEPEKFVIQFKPS